MTHVGKHRGRRPLLLRPAVIAGSAAAIAVVSTAGVVARQVIEDSPAGLHAIPAISGQTRTDTSPTGSPAGSLTLLPSTGTTTATPGGTSTQGAPLWTGGTSRRGGSSSGSGSSSPTTSSSTARPPTAPATTTRAAPTTPPPSSAPPSTSPPAPPTPPDTPTATPTTTPATESVTPTPSDTSTDPTPSGSPADT